MKKLLLSPLAIVLFFSCDKKEPVKLSVLQTTADSVGLEFNVPYKLTVFQNTYLSLPGTVSDTIIFSAADTITEIFNGIIYSYFCPWTIPQGSFPIRLGDTMQNSSYLILMTDTAYTNSPKPLFEVLGGGVIARYITGPICLDGKPTLGARLNNTNWTDSFGFTYYAYARLTR